MRSRLDDIADEVGLVMKQRDVLINSRKALGAAEFAREHGKFDEMHHALFKAHWELTGKLEDVDDLVRIGTEVGLDPVELQDSRSRKAVTRRSSTKTAGWPSRWASMRFPPTSSAGATSSSARSPTRLSSQVIDKLREESAAGGS